MRVISFLALLLSANPAFAISGQGNPWEAIDDAKCAGLKAADFAAAVGAKTEITAAARTAATETAPAVCRVTAMIAPSIGVEIRMPLAEWNGRFLFTGCGGLCGAINSATGNDALKRGYAVATTDMWHQTGQNDRSWANDDALVEDYNHRATHLGTLLGKAAVVAHYGKPQTKSYWRGCSTGGRQGLVEALRYPTDFDGIIAGAPAADMANPHNAWSYLSTLDNKGKSVLDVPAITLLRDEVQKACGKDGIVENPLKCDFDPARLQCAAGGKDKCLTPVQVAAARRMYDGAGPQFYSMGYSRGSEGGWIRSLVGEDGKPPGRAGSAAFFVEKNIGPTAKVAAFDFATYGVLGSPIGGRLEQGADNTGLATFAGRGGKILMYHGWNDVDVTPAVSVDFRKNAVAGLGEAMVDSFLRLFFMPGMAHCRNGPGPDSADYLTAIENWVEKGEAPERLVVAKTRLKEANYVAYPLAPADVILERPVGAFRP